MSKVLKDGLNVISGDCKGIILDNDYEATEEIENINYYIQFEDNTREWLLKKDFSLID